MMIRNKLAFTITEILVVVIIVGIIAAFAIPGYNKSVERQYERNMILGLRTVAGAQRVYYVKNKEYWPEGFGAWDTGPTMNSGLGITLYNGQACNLVTNKDPCYFCMGYSDDDQEYHCKAGDMLGGFNIAVKSDVNNGEPYCHSGACPACQDAASGGCP